MTVLMTVAAILAPSSERAAITSWSRVTATWHRAAIRWNVSEAMLRRKAWCESRMNPGAYNASSGSSGLFQFIPSTWRTMPYRWHSIWSARWNALAAAWMHHVGRGGEWTCR